jgi:LAO/AO transport system kinase
LKQPAKLRYNADYYAEGVLRGDRVILAKAITLIESSLAADQIIASGLVEKVIHNTGRSIRIGITGVPGVGKSTFIEAFGKHVTALGKKIAVLTIDPSSQRSHGSILGDKTRMEELSRNPLAFIRPSAAGDALGGVSHKTREAMLLCEAAGFEVILIETVGVGQSEVSVKNMVDFFLLLMLARAGDELQGIKKGIMEMADTIVITKSDGDNIKHASNAKAEYQHALHLFPPSPSGWQTNVLTASAVTGAGIEDTWNSITEYHNKTTTSGFFENNRRQQNIAWLHECFRQLLNQDFQRSTQLHGDVQELEAHVSQQKMTPYTAARRLLDIYHDFIRKSWNQKAD